MANVFKIEHSQKVALENLCLKYGVRELSLFGSALGHDFQPTSDIDFLVDFKPEAHAGFLALGKLQEELENLFQREVHLVPKQGLKPIIKERVLSQARLVYAG